MYAGNETGVINASVEFDEKTLQPTYRLIVGVAGASSGLEIARRFGVPRPIIDTAMHSVKDSSIQATEYLKRIKSEAQTAEELRLALEEERAAVAEKFASLEKEAAQKERERQSSFEQTVQRTVADLEKRARELVSRVSDRAERLKVEREAQRQIAEMKREAQRATKAMTPIESGTATNEVASKSIRIVRDGKVISKSEQSLEEPIQYVSAPQREIVVGDRVKLKSFGSIGIVDSIKNGEAEVRVKALRFREKLENLELVEAAPEARGQKSKLEDLRRAAVAEVHLTSAEDPGRSELNVIGQTTDEAVDAVDKFLDEASLASLIQVRIIHGHGTGALRRAIGNLLKEHPHVARFVAAPPDQGGTGATLVELRQ
jgi:DNA mismatch repair protein MutS2